MPKHKLVMGIPTFGRSWRLSNPAVHGVEAAAIGPGAVGEYTQEMGILGYNEVHTYYCMEEAVFLKVARKGFIFVLVSQ